MKDKESVYLVAFFKFKENAEYGFTRMHLQHIFKTKEEAIAKMSFCDEAGWYEGVLIEERSLGDSWCKGQRIWFLQQEGGSLKEIPEPEFWNDVFNIIG